MRLWNVTDLRRPVSITTLTDQVDGAADIAFNPTSTILAIPDKTGGVQLWDTEDPHYPKILSQSIRIPSPIRGLAFDPDGTILATSGDDRAIRLWDISRPQQPQLLATFTGSHEGIVRRISFNPKRKIFATGSDDKSVRLWTADPDQIAERACASPTGQITQDEWRRYLPNITYQSVCPQS